MLFWVTYVPAHARQLELAPQTGVLHHQLGVFTCQHEELRADTEAVKGDFREHDLSSSTCQPSVYGSWFVVEYLDEALAGRSVEECGVSEVERVKWDATWGEESEHGVGGIVEKGVG